MPAFPSRRLRRGGLLVWLLLVILGCMGCCCGGVPLFGLWPRLDAAPVQAALLGQPLIVDHTCRPTEVCAEVLSVDATVYPLSYSLFSGEVQTLVEVEATCREPVTTEGRGRTLACAGVVAAVFAAAEGAGEGFELRYVTENTFGAESSGLPYEGGGGGDWDD